MSNRVEEIVRCERDTCVRASAGTGKTFLLVEKFIHLLSLKDEKGKYTRLENILAITFTDKAAEEMRQRITTRILEKIKTLKEEGGRENKVLVTHLRAVRRIINKGYISTIHSFCARVLKENPLEAGLDPHFEIIDADRSSLMQSKALERFLLDKLRKGDTVAEDLIYRFGFDSDFGFENSLSGSIKSILPLVRSSGNSIVDSNNLLSEYRQVLQDVSGSLKGFKKSTVSAIGSLKELANTEKQREGLEKLDLLMADFRSDKNLLTRDGLFGAFEIFTLLKAVRFPAGDGKVELGKAKEAIDSYVKLLTSSLASETASGFISLLGEFSEFMELRVKGRDKLDFDDLQERTLELLRRNDQIRNHYRELFRDVLVDEFQDVNGLQKMIIEELAKPGEGKLFIVGDAKQAIYGFRGGDLEVFENLEGEILSNGGERFVLQNNRRSNEGLVDFVNDYFSEYEGTIFGKDDKCTSLNEKPINRPVELYTVVSNTLDADERRFKEATILAARISSLTKDEDVKNGDIVILLKKFSALPVYEAALDEAGVSYTIHRGTGFYRSQEIADMISVLSFIDDPSDIVSWVGSLRSPYSACSDKTILSLRRDGEGGVVSPFKYLRYSVSEIKIDDPIEKAKFVDFVSWIGVLVRVKDRMTVSEIIERCLEESRIAGILGAQPEGLQKVANLHKLIETARMMEHNSDLSLKNFVRHFKNLYDREEREASAVVAVEDSENVKIMTLHQSKGLEFPIVFMPDVSAQTPSPRGHIIFHKVKGVGAKYVDKRSLDSYSGVVFESVRDELKNKEVDESKRLFYVGCTRAKDRLILSGNRKESGSAIPFLEDLQKFKEESPAHFYDGFDMQKTVVGKVDDISIADALLAEEPVAVIDSKVSRELDPIVSSDAGREVSIGVYPLLAYERCRREYILRELMRVPAEYGSKNIPKGGAKRVKNKLSYSPLEVGSAVHSALELVDYDLPADQFEMEVEKIIISHLPGLSKKEVNEIVARVLRLYRSEMFEQLRNGELRETGREIPFKSRFAGGRDSYLLNGKIDLMVRDRDNRVTIVDYKYASGKDDIETYRFQLEAYACAAARILQIDTVSCAIVFFGGPGVKTIGWDMNRSSLAKTEKKILSVMDGITELEKSVIGSGDLLESGFPELEGENKKFICPNRRCPYTQICEASSVIKKK